MRLFQRVYEDGARRTRGVDRVRERTTHFGTPVLTSRSIGCMSSRLRLVTHSRSFEASRYYTLMVATSPTSRRQPARPDGQLRRGRTRSLRSSRRRLGRGARPRAPGFAARYGARTTPAGAGPTLKARPRGADSPTRGTQKRLAHLGICRSIPSPGPDRLAWTGLERASAQPRPARQGAPAAPGRKGPAGRGSHSLPEHGQRAIHVSSGAPGTPTPAGKFRSPQELRWSVLRSGFRASYFNRRSRFTNTRTGRRVASPGPPPRIGTAAREPIMSRRGRPQGPRVHLFADRPHLPTEPR